MPIASHAASSASTREMACSPVSVTESATRVISGPSLSVAGHTCLKLNPVSCRHHDTYAKCKVYAYPTRRRRQRPVGTRQIVLRISSRSIATCICFMRCSTAETAVLHSATSSPMLTAGPSFFLKSFQSGVARAVSVKVLRAIQPLNGCHRTHRQHGTFAARERRRDAHKGAREPRRACSGVLSLSEDGVRDTRERGHARTSIDSLYARRASA